MEQFNNLAENFFREIRNIEIYESKDLRFEHQLKSVFPDTAKILYKIDIIPEDFSRKVQTKTKNGNYFFNIELGFPLLQMDLESVRKYFDYFNEKKFAVVLNSNTEKTMIGNDREPLKIEILDNKTDDDSGKDEFNMSITGETIIYPKISF